MEIFRCICWDSLPRQLIIKLLRKWVRTFSIGGKKHFRNLWKSYSLCDHLDLKLDVDLYKTMAQWSECLTYLQEVVSLNPDAV